MNLLLRRSVKVAIRSDYQCYAYPLARFCQGGRCLVVIVPHLGNHHLPKCALCHQVVAFFYFFLYSKEVLLLKKLVFKKDISSTYSWSVSIIDIVYFQWQTVV